MILLYSVFGNENRTFAAVKYFLYILFCLTVMNISCSNDCTSCEPFTEEPYVLVRFYNAADTSKRILVIDSVNQTPAIDLRHFNDTTWQFRFPLNMHEDVSTFDIVARDTSHLDSITYYHSIRFDYTRQFVRRADNFIISECDLTAMETDLTNDNLECKEEETCISNDAKVSLYY